MGGSNDGSGTGQAAEDANDQDPEDDSAAKPIREAAAAAAEMAPAAAAAAAAGPGSKTTGEAMSVISEERTTSAQDDSEGGLEKNGTPRKGGTLSSPDQTAAESANGEEAVRLPDNTENDVDEGPPQLPLAGASAVSGSIGVVPPFEASSQAANGVLQNAGEAAANGATESLPGIHKDAAAKAGVGKARGVEKHSESGQGRQAVGEGGSGAASKGVEGLKNAAARKKEADGMKELLESSASHTVDCLIYIRWCVRV